MGSFLFYLVAGTAVTGAFLTVTLAKPTRALLALIMTMFALAVLYLKLGAPFVAMANLIVYAGAVLVLFLFVIMLQGIGAKDIPLSKRFSQSHLLLATLVSLSFTGLFWMILKRTSIPAAQGVSGTIESFAEILFKNYLLPFELTSLLLLVGVFAAVNLAKKDPS